MMDRHLQADSPEKRRLFRTGSTSRDSSEPRSFQVFSHPTVFHPSSPPLQADARILSAHEIVYICEQTSVPLQCESLNARQALWLIAEPARVVESSTNDSSNQSLMITVASLTGGSSSGDVMQSVDAVSIGPFKS